MKRTRNATPNASVVSDPSLPVAPLADPATNIVNTTPSQSSERDGKSDPNDNSGLPTSGVPKRYRKDAMTPIARAEQIAQLLKSSVHLPAISDQKNLKRPDRQIYWKIYYLQHQDRILEQHKQRWQTLPSDQRLLRLEKMRERARNRVKL